METHYLAPGAAPNGPTPSMQCTLDQPHVQGLGCMLHMEPSPAAVEYALHAGPLAAAPGQATVVLRWPEQVLHVVCTQTGWGRCCVQCMPQSKHWERWMQHGGVLGEVWFCGSHPACGASHMDWPHTTHHTHRAG